VKLALGTAQFGFPYGIANASGQVCLDEAAAILDQAWKAGFRVLDTAISYGESEQRLGMMGVGGWQVVSKLPGLPEPGVAIGGLVREWVAGSLRRLRIPRLAGVLLHRPQQLLSSHGEDLYYVLAGLVQEGVVEKIGVSIYDPAELDALCTRFRFDLVQSPFNVFDQRLLKSGWLRRMHDAGIEVHTRSAFLQGLLLMTPSSRPKQFDRWRSLWDEWDRWLEEQGLTPLQACLGFVLSHSEIDCVVVGVDNVRQLQDIVRATSTKPVSVPSSLATDEAELIHPSLWAKA